MNGELEKKEDERPNFFGVQVRMVCFDGLSGAKKTNDLMLGSKFTEAMHSRNDDKWPRPGGRHSQWVGLRFHSLGARERRELFPGALGSTLNCDLWTKTEKITGFLLSKSDCLSMNLFKILKSFESLEKIQDFTATFRLWRKIQKVSWFLHKISVFFRFFSWISSGKWIQEIQVFSSN